MSDGLFDFEETFNTCPNPGCDRPLSDGRCVWCNPMPNTRPKVMARADGPATSREAAKVVAYRTGTQKARILVEYGAVNDYGLTDDEVARILGFTETNAARKRCSDLRNEGMIEPNGTTRLGKSGIANDVCVVTDKGMATLASMKESHAHQPNPVPVPPSPATYAVCRYCGYANGDHADYCSEWPDPHVHVWTWSQRYDYDGNTAEVCRECGAIR